MLSTPPAFILSQDQTLVISSFRQDQPFWLIHPFLLFSASSEAEVHHPISLLMLVLWISLFKKFSRIVVYCLIIKVRLFLCQATARIYYHITFRLSRTFFKFFEVFFELLFLGRLSRVSLHIISLALSDVNTFFTIFYIFFFPVPFVPFSSYSSLYVFWPSVHIRNITPKVYSMTYVQRDRMPLQCAAGQAVNCNQAAFALG